MDRDDRIERKLSWIVGFLRWWVVEGRFGGPVDPIVADRRATQARIEAELERRSPEIYERARAAVARTHERVR